MHHTSRSDYQDDVVADPGHTITFSKKAGHHVRAAAQHDIVTSGSWHEITGSAFQECLLPETSWTVTSKPALKPHPLLSRT